MKPHEVEDYFRSLETGVERALELAKKAREKGYDPELEPEIAVTKDFAERVERLLELPGIAEEIRKLEGKLSREELALQVAERIATRDLEADERTIAERALKVALAILTEAVPGAAVLEGITKVEIKKNPGGSRYLAVHFASPIRAAGGTAAALSILVADLIRRKLHLDRYIPTDEEVERYVEEVEIYSEMEHLQFTPSPDDVRLAARNLPVEVTGEPSSREMVVTVHRNLPRVEHNFVRGGAVLALVEGVLQKAPKLIKYAEKLELDGWEWLKKIAEKLQTSGAREEEEGEEEEETEEEEAEEGEEEGERYLEEVIGGRPVFCHPRFPGGFRLRYGRARNTGYATVGMHPATMYILDEFPAVGTQLKTEFPGKAATVAPVDTIEGPTVKLKNGSVVRITSVEQAKELRGQIEEILFLGDLLVSFGEFLENNHPLLPPAWCEEWWAKEVTSKVPPEKLEKIKPHLFPPFPPPPPEVAVGLSEEFKVPLHPAYTYAFEEVTGQQLYELAEWLEKGDPTFEDGVLKSLRIPLEEGPKRTLELLGVPHEVRNGEVVLTGHALPLAKCLALFQNKRREILLQKEPLEALQELAGFPIYRRSPTIVGARMGRPEKASPRKMKPPPHVLFPVSTSGGPTRNLIKAAEKLGEEGGELYVEVVRLVCPSCNNITIRRKCEKCGTKTEYVKIFPCCKREAKAERCPAHGGKAAYYDTRGVPLKTLLQQAAQRLGERLPDEIKGVKGLTSAYRFPEPLEKGILRAKHGVFVFKDGTVRFDLTNMPLTHFRPREVGVSVEKLRELGYTHDITGAPLQDENQLLELKIQDVIISRECANYLLSAAGFVDDLLEKFYGLPRFYNCKRPEDLIGHLLIAIAPHTSVGVVARIVGFTEGSVCFAHPFFHAARRRDCFTADAVLPLLIDGKGWRIVRLGEFVEELIKHSKPERTEFGDIVVKTEGIYTLALDRDFRYKLKPVVAFSKHPAQDHLVRLEARGKSLLVSGLHPVLDRRLEKVEAYRASRILLPARVEIPEEDIAELDLLDFVDERSTAVVGVNETLEKFCRERGLTKLEMFKTAARLTGRGWKTLRDYFYVYGCMPVDVLRALGIPIPREVRLKQIRTRRAVPRFIKVDRHLLRLLGFYVAEGYLRRRKGSVSQVNFAVCDQTRVRELRKIIKKCFGISPTLSGYTLTISSRIIHDFFEGLGCGSRAVTKRVPPFIFSLPLEKVKYFLQGYFEGDGGVHGGERIEVACTSATEMLLRDIEFLLLRFGIPSSLQRDERIQLTSRAGRFRLRKGLSPKFLTYKLRIYGRAAADFCMKIGFMSEQKNRKAREILLRCRLGKLQTGFSFGEVFEVPVKKEIVKAPQPLYSFTVDQLHNAIVSGLSVGQCDGDQDAVMLLLDGLLNFSRRFLPEKRGGMMDAPLMLITRISPREVDKEAHHVEVSTDLPLEFYHTAAGKNPSELLHLVEVVESRLGTDKQYEFGFEFDTSDISGGPVLSKYKLLGTMEEKILSQLKLAEKIRAVDERDVAQRLIEHHFIPDIKGNLRTFASQKFRCTSCNKKYRRIPLSGVCTCGGNLVLTVSRGGIEKYVKLANQIAEKYHVSDYLKQRLRLVEVEIKSLFESDSSKQLSLADFL
jgi:DNA polymerase II large subunit